MKISVLLSGGVDSSVTLALLKDQGYTDITAYYLKIWLEDELSYLGSCPWEEDLAFAEAVCMALNIPLKVINLQNEYFDRVVEYAIAELRIGRTPSPDIFCNQRVKFGAFFDKVAESFDFVATGHYACLRETPRPQINIPHKDKTYSRLYRGIDPVKDQTYFLSHLSQDQLSKILVPLGTLPKARVREIAREKQLATMQRPDSQGICFLGKIPYNEFVKHYLGENQGPIVDLQTGKKMGIHNGFWFHTIGQRSGLGLSNGPWYVSAKDSNENIIYVSKREDNPEVFRTRFSIEELVWTSGISPLAENFSDWNEISHDTIGINEGESFANAIEVGSEHGPAHRNSKFASQTTRGLNLKLRHGPQMIPCKIAFDDSNPSILNVSMETPDAGIAAGQFAVLYLDDEVLGSGRMCALDDDKLSSYLKLFKEVESQEDRLRREKKRLKDEKRARYFNS